MRGTTGYRLETILTDNNSGIIIKDPQVLENCRPTRVKIKYVFTAWAPITEPLIKGKAGCLRQKQLWAISEKTIS
jgi:hypothetical protein